MLRDEDGFQMKYVPKDQIIEESTKKHGKRERKGTDASNSSYIYVKKEN